jgi:hypothetical protein
VTIGLLIEGETDRKVVRAFLEKAHDIDPSRPGVAERVVNRSDLLQPTRVIRQIRSNLLPTVNRLDRVIVLVDAECDDPALLDRRRLEVETQVGRESFPVRFRLMFVRFAIESWLLADLAAWSPLLRSRSTGMLESLTDNCDPKHAIYQAMSPHGVEFRPTIHDPQIARRVDLEVARHRSSNLNDFIEATASSGDP